MTATTARCSTSLHLDWQATPALFVSNKLYFNHYDDDRRASPSATAQQPA